MEYGNGYITPTSVPQDEGHGLVSYHTPRDESPDLESQIASRISWCMALGVDTGACFHLIGRQGVARTHHSQNQTCFLLTSGVYSGLHQRTMARRTLKDSGVCGFLQSVSFLVGQGSLTATS